MSWKATILVSLALVALALTVRIAGHHARPAATPYVQPHHH